MHPPLALILDFNGTLSDDEPLLERLFRDALLEEAGVEMSAEQYHEELVGLSDPEIAENALRLGGIDPSPHLVERILREKVEGYLREVDENPPITNAAIEFVEASAARVPVGIASGAFREEIEFVLDLTGTRDRFDAIVSIDDVEQGKPEPESYLLALQRINEATGGSIGAADVLTIEDSSAGVAAALAAGMRCAAVAGDQRAEGNADFVIQRLDAETATRLLGAG